MIRTCAITAGWTLFVASFAVGLGLGGWDLFSPGLWTTSAVSLAAVATCVRPDVLSATLPPAGLALAVTTTLFSIVPESIPDLPLLLGATACAAAVALVPTAAFRAGRTALVSGAVAAGLVHLLMMHAISIALHGPDSSIFTNSPGRSLIIPLVWLLVALSLSALPSRTGIAPRR